MLATRLYIDSDLLEEKLDNSIYKIEYIVKELGISRQAFDKKRKGKVAFRASEVYVLCDLLNINTEERNNIFCPKG